jgi:hypothetical protein
MIPHQNESPNVEKKKKSLSLFSFWLNFAKEKNWWQHLSINEGSLFALFNNFQTIAFLPCFLSYWKALNEYGCIEVVW